MKRNLSDLQSRRVSATTLAFTLAYGVQTLVWLPHLWRFTGSPVGLLVTAGLLFVAMLPWAVFLFLLSLTPEEPLPTLGTWIAQVFAEARFLFFAPTYTFAIVGLVLGVPLRQKRVQLINGLRSFFESGWASTPAPVRR